MNLTYADVEKRMSHYPPADAETMEAHGLLRELAKAHAKAVMDLLPAGREKSLVMTALEEALMWANAAIARNGGPAPHIQITEIEVIRNDFGVHYGTAPREGGVTLGGRDAHLTPASDEGSRPL
jgi:hypothetical protein